MKIIFLDIDGVLNSATFLARTFKEREQLATEGRGAVDHWAAMIDPDAVRLLNLIIEVSNAKCVLSSSWRISHPLAEMRGILTQKGFAGELIDKTPNRSPVAPYRRGNEIQSWMDSRSDITEFVILDDDSDMEHLSPKLVQTSWQDGLLKEHLDPALKLLGI